MRAKGRGKCPILIEAAGRRAPSELFASGNESPAEIAIMIRERGWKPYRARFDEALAAWIVSTIDWQQSPTHSNR